MKFRDVTKVDVPNRTITVRRLVFGRQKFLVEQIESVQLRRIPSLIDEIGLYGIAGTTGFFIRETDAAFAEFRALIPFDEVFGGDWYQKAEAGNLLEVRRPG